MRAAAQARRTMCLCMPLVSGEMHGLLSPVPAWEVDACVVANTGRRPRTTLEALEPRPSGYKSDDDEPCAASSAGEAAAGRAPPDEGFPGSASPGPALPGSAPRGWQPVAAPAPARGPAGTGVNGAVGGLGLGSGEGDAGPSGGGLGRAGWSGVVQGGDDAELSLADLDFLEASGMTGVAAYLRDRCRQVTGF